ncbi:unnamed protein product [Musa textilis]
MQTGEKKRRLTVEQVRTLEKNFEQGNKLEPERKMQLARALGLQPRQVAIWFQNRRARWKTKQLEKDYDVLKRQFEAMKSENEALRAQNQKLHAEVPVNSQTFVLPPVVAYNAQISALKGREAPELINLNKETEGSCSNRSENSSEINLDISRTSVTESPLSPHQSLPFIHSIRPADMDQLLQSSSRPEMQSPKIETGATEGSFSNLLCGMEDQSASFWPCTHSLTKSTERTFRFPTMTRMSRLACYLLLISRSGSSEIAASAFWISHVSMRDHPESATRTIGWATRRHRGRSIERPFRRRERDRQRPVVPPSWIARSEGLGLRKCSADFNVKLSDFGLAKDGPTGDRSHVSTRVIGTYGYAAPEYIATGRLNAKADVYSFGVLLLELLTGRRAHDKIRVAAEQNLVDWTRPSLGDKRKLHRIIDPRLEGRYPKNAAHELASLALQCIRNDAKLRPNMSEVLASLEKLQDPKYAALPPQSNQRKKSSSTMPRSPMRNPRSPLRPTSSGSSLPAYHA